MNLREKTFLRLLLLTCLSFGVLFLLTLAHTQKTLYRLETQQAQESLDRLGRVLALRLENLDTTCADWAAWDATYAFMADGNERYRQENLMEETFTTLRLGYLLFARPDGTLLYGKGFDRELDRPLPVPGTLRERLLPGGPLQDIPPGKSRRGLWVTPQGIYLVAARSILNSQFQGPSRGTLVMMRPLDASELRSISSEMGFPVSARPFSVGQPPVDFSFITSGFTSRTDTRLIVPVNDDTLSAYVLLKDLFGEVAVMAKVDLPRWIALQTRQTLLLHLLSILGAGILTVGCFLLGVERGILQRLRDLRDQVKRFDPNSPQAPSPCPGGDDEIAQLGRGVESLMEQARERGRSEQEQRDIMRQVLDQIRDMVLFCSLEGEVTFANEAFRRQVGGTRQQAAGRPIWNLVHPEDQETFREGLHRLLLGEPLEAPLSCRILTLRGPLRVAFLANLVRDRNGTPKEVALSARETDEGPRSLR